MVRIDGKCGKIMKLFRENKGKTVRIKINKEYIDIGLGFLSAPKGFGKLSSAQMKKILDKPYYGWKKGNMVCISTEEPLYGDLKEIKKRKR